MKIALVHNAILPVHKYGGTERVIWDLAKELHRRGHEVTFVVKKASQIGFGTKIAIEDIRNINKDLPKDIDIVHFHSEISGMEHLEKPYVYTMHGNVGKGVELDINTIFVSRNHAERYGSISFVYNGLDWNEYAKPSLNNDRKYFHFLGKGAWRVKNLQGAIDLIKKTQSEKIYVLGGVRFNFNMGIRFTFTPKARFLGMVNNATKSKIMSHSKGLIFPVLWNEPFGLAIIESLYFGCPVFGTPYGSLPELITEEVGFLSNREEELLQAIQQSEQYDRQYCHQYALETFNASVMAEQYIAFYEKILDGEKINSHKPTLIKEEPKYLDWIKNK